jgi:hypothetical protein
MGQCHLEIERVGSTVTTFIHILDALSSNLSREDTAYPEWVPVVFLSPSKQMRGYLD